MIAKKIAGCLAFRLNRPAVGEVTGAAFRGDRDGDGCG